MTASEEPTHDDPETRFRRLLLLADLPHGEKRELEVDGQVVLLCNWQDTVFAVSGICTHAEERLACGKFARGWIACPVHGARFDLATGSAMNPPATQPLQTWKIRLSDGWIEVAI